MLVKLVMPKAAPLARMSVKSEKVSTGMNLMPDDCSPVKSVVLYPAEALTGAVSYPAIAGWYACWLLLGVALLDTEADWVTLPAMPGTGDG